MAVDPHELKEAWLGRALASAGIDRARWRPGRGVRENRGTIEAVYRYYGRLFVEHPHLQWAGMASIIGPAFYAGFMDIGFLPDAVRRAVLAVFGRTSRRLASRLAGELGFYEATFLTMQKKIFEDQATMHEAYVDGGVAEIEMLYSARIVDSATLEAWRQIDAGRRGGDPALVDRGNRTLLFREQHDIIDRFYLRMLRRRPPIGPVFTYLLTLAGAPSVPGALSYPERYPLTLVARLPRTAISVRTPLADGNIAVFANRWKLIEDDTLPDYVRLVHERAEWAAELAATPVARRARAFRVLKRAWKLLAAAITRWRVRIGPVPSERRVLGVAPTKPVLEARADAATIDLASAPSRADAGFDAGSESRVWTGPRRRTLDVKVRLPGDRTYSARAAMAVMLSSTRGGEPERLVVRLPPAGLDATEALLTGYARDWAFSAAAVEGWRTGAERRTDSDRAYSTHAFTPDALGFVRLEFQAAHHVLEGEFVVTALFSWRATRTA